MAYRPIDGYNLENRTLLKEAIFMPSRQNAIVSILVVSVIRQITNIVMDGVF